MRKCLMIGALLLGYLFQSAQTTPFREGRKWGIKDGSKIIIPAKYDTIFNFEPAGKMCLACFRIKGSSGNKFIKVTTVNYSCNYLNKMNRRLEVRNEAGDTSSVFSLGKTTVKQLNEETLFPVSLKGAKHLVNKEFRQLTFRGYHSVAQSPDPAFYLAEWMNEAETVFSGVIDRNEKVLVPFLYSGIKFNTGDSLIIACSAGVRNSSDDIYDYSGKKAGSYPRHVDQATRKFIIHKLYEPRERYIVYNIETKEERDLTADEVEIYSSDEILIKQKHDWYLYDMNKHQKKPFKRS